MISSRTNKSMSVFEYTSSKFTSQLSSSVCWWDHIQTLCECVRTCTSAQECLLCQQSLTVVVVVAAAVVVSPARRETRHSAAFHQPDEECPFHRGKVNRDFNRWIMWLQAQGWLSLSKQGHNSSHTPGAKPDRKQSIRRKSMQICYLAHLWSRLEIFLWSHFKLDESI